MHVIVNGAAWIDHGWGLAGMERLQYRRDRADVDYRVLCSDCEADPPLRPALVAKFRVLSERLLPAGTLLPPMVAISRRRSGRKEVNPRFVVAMIGSLRSCWSAKNLRAR